VVYRAIGYSQRPSRVSSEQEQMQLRIKSQADFAGEIPVGDGIVSGAALSLRNYCNLALAN